MAITPVDAKYFQSLSGSFNCLYFCIAPEGTKIESIFKQEFWQKVASTAATHDRLHVDDLIRIRAVDRSFDLMLTITNFRSDRTPVLVRWPNDPLSLARADVTLPSFIPRTRAEACEALGVALDASDEIIKGVGDALRRGNHPDNARDEGDRQRREAKSKQINAALDLLSGKRKAAAA